MKLTFHHINFVSKDVDKLNTFYKEILQMKSIADINFPRTKSNDKSGYDGKIKFVTEGSMQMHLAEKDLNIASKNKRHINPVERGHIAFRTDDIEEFKKLLVSKNIPFADYGTIFAKEWYQIFFYDPEGNIIEVHQLLNN